MSYNEEEIEVKAEELRRKLKDPKVMQEIMKDAYIPVGVSDVDLLDAVLQNADLSEEQQDEP